MGINTTMQNMTGPKPNPNLEILIFFLSSLLSRIFSPIETIYDNSKKPYILRFGYFYSCLRYLLCWIVTSTFSINYSY